MPLPPVVIDVALVGSLLAEQFPQWSHLPVRPVPLPGWDNKSFRIGDELLARLPSAVEYTGQVLREQRWLPFLRPHLPLAVPEPIALGFPGSGYPWPWSVYRWLPGESASPESISPIAEFTSDLARFLVRLHSAPATGGPLPGPENFFRGGSLTVYDRQFRAALKSLDGCIDATAALRAWRVGVGSEWRRDPVWVHGDISVGNLLLTDGKLSGVIDFGQVAIGDPACDLAIAWTLLRGSHREEFRRQLGFDTATWYRGRGWALWKAAVVAADLTETNAAEGAAAWETIEEVLLDCASTKA